MNHPLNVFVDAFIAGQIETILRLRSGPTWPLNEFFRDKVKKHRKVADQFLQPLLEKGIASKVAKATAVVTDQQKEETEPLNLLEHLINHSDGERTSTTVDNIQPLNGR